MSASNDAKVVLVTGANKGIGFEVVRLLAAAQPAWTILLGARSQANADLALAKLPEQARKNVHFVQIDVTDDASVAAAAAQVKERYGKLDVLVNNAGIAANQHTHENAVQTFQTNVYGVKRCDDAFLPLIPAGGKIVTVSSEVGSWAQAGAPAALREQLNSPDLTWESLDRLAQEYLESTKPEGKGAERFPRAADSFGSYGPSKMFVSQYGRIRAKELLKDERRIPLLLVTPGYCATDLNHHSGPRSAEVGGKSVLLALERGEAEASKLYLDADEVPLEVEPPADIKEQIAILAATQQEQKQ